MIFYLRERDTLVFTMDDSNIISARIFQEDGFEVDYLKRRMRGKEMIGRDWFLQIHLDSDEGLIHINVAKSDEG